jgi:ankyrin repeat protein
VFNAGADSGCASSRWGKTGGAQMSFLWRLFGVRTSRGELCEAALRGDKERVCELLAQGVNVQESSKRHEGYTPIHYAAESGHSEIVDILIAHGANPNTRTKLDGETPLHLAAAEGNFKVAEQLLRAGVDVDIKAHTGGTPLHRAAIGGHVSLAQLLISRGTDVNATDRDGRTPLYFAIGYAPQPQMAEFLLVHGANPNPPPLGGLTLVHLAERSGNQMLLSILRKHGAE